MEWTDIYVARIIKIEEHHAFMWLWRIIVLSGPFLEHSLAHELTPVPPAGRAHHFKPKPMSEPYSYHVAIRPWEAKHEQDTPIYQHRPRSADQPSTHPENSEAASCWNMPVPGCWLPACLFLQMRLKSLKIRSLIKLSKYWDEKKCNWNNCEDSTCRHM